MRAPQGAMGVVILQREKSKGNVFFWRATGVRRQERAGVGWFRWRRITTVQDPVESGKCDFTEFSGLHVVR